MSNGIQSVCKSRAVFAFVVELHLRSYQERKCESLQSNFKLKQSFQIQIFPHQNHYSLWFAKQMQRNSHKSSMESGNAAAENGKC